MAQGHVTPVDQSELQEPRDQVTPVQLDEVSSLRQALEMAEQQAQLINSEYGKLLREKEVKQRVRICRHVVSKSIWLACVTVRVVLSIFGLYKDTHHT